MRTPARGGAPRPTTERPPPDDETREFYPIGDLARDLGISQRTIRFYETRGLIAPARKGANRIFSRRDRARMRLILRGKNLGFSLEEIADYLSLYDADPGQIAQTRMLLHGVEQQIATLTGKRADIDRTLKELRQIKAQCEAHLAGRTDGSG